MITMLNYEGRLIYLSDDIYVVKRDIANTRLKKGDQVRLISGINNSDIPGFHFDQTSVTVCPANSDVPRWIGVYTTNLRKLE